MMRNRIMIHIFLLYLISFSYEYELNNWTIGGNEIIINSYSSNLTEEQRDNYYYWVGLRNSFYYSEDSEQLENLVKYFTPEEDNYYRKLFKFSTPGFICAAGVIIIVIAYLVKRFLLKGCKGPKEKNMVKSYNISTYIFLIIGFLVGIIFLSLTIYNSAKSK